MGHQNIDNNMLDCLTPRRIEEPTIVGIAKVNEVKVGLCSKDAAC